MEDNTNPGNQPIQPATPAPEEPAQPMQIPVNDSTVEPAAEPVVEPVAPNIIADSPSEAGAAEFASEETPLQNEILQELNDPDEIVEAASTMTPEQPKKGRTLTILVILLVLVAVGLAGTFAYLYFTKPTIKLTDNTSSSNTSTDPVNPSTNTNTTDTTNTTIDQTNTTASFTKEGDTITNSETISELTEKVSLLFGYKFDDNLIISTGGSVAAEDIDLITNGDLKETYRINHLAFSSTEARDLTDQEVETIENEDNISLVLTDKKGIDGDIFAAAYENLFGKELEKGPVEKSACSFSYNKTVDVYYNGNGGCGGYTSYFRYYHITDFTEKEDTAYVYIQAASVESDSAVFCDVSKEIQENGTSATVKTCAPALTETTGPEDFFADTTANFARYRFVFNQADDGSYYFVKVEKV
ncbi:MAG: hypothetical protein K6G36_00515 [Candidatus Saccharibacteria bacterium]|nr:hypothetical protein [Candidatus Saccharibacteria bacterium]